MAAETREETRDLFLAVDIGASSGRHILSYVEDGKLYCEEIYRFKNGMDENGGHKVWDTERLINEVVSGMKECARLGKIPKTMGIDTWAVDYVLLDGEDQPVGRTYAYRDDRTKGMDEKVYEVIPEKALYRRTGIQKAIFNTIYQLMAVKEQEPESFAKAESLLMLPDYLNFLLTGEKKQEYTNATSTGLVDPDTKEWDLDLIDRLGYPRKLFQKLTLPGTFIGKLSEEMEKEVGFSCKVVAAASHDTASAVMSVPTEDDNAVYISSGTWSLFGCELMEANTKEAAGAANFTNEGGYDYRYRFLKNIMGLWMIQSVRNEYIKRGEEYSFGELCELAEEASADALVDANDERFLAPDSMIEEVQAAVKEQGITPPETPGEVDRMIYRSLAECYRKAVKELEEIRGEACDAIYIVGGGANADYLNRLTASATGKTVFAGPTEATAIGNLGAQMIADGVFTDLKDFRRGVKRSFTVKEYNS